MDLNKIKIFIKDKPLWLKVVVTLLCSLIIGLGVWFGISSCASLELDKVEYTDDDHYFNADGIKLHPKDVSLIDSRDDAFKLCQYIETVSLYMTDDDKSLLLDNYGLNYDTYVCLLNSYNLIVDNSNVYLLEEIK